MQWVLLSMLVQSVMRKIAISILDLFFAMYLIVLYSNRLVAAFQILCFLEPPVKDLYRSQVKRQACT